MKRKLLAVGAMLLCAVGLSVYNPSVTPVTPPSPTPSLGAFTGADFSIEPSNAIAEAPNEFVVYAGSSDSTEIATQWFSVRRCSRVYVRMLSERSAFAVGTDVDSLFSDSISVFKVLMSDSIPSGGPFDQAADSIVWDVSAGAGTVIYGDSITMAMISPTPLNKILRAPANGSGQGFTISPMSNYPTSTAIKVADSSPYAGFNKRYMRFRITPLRRCTPSPTNACPNRVNGLKNFRVYVTAIKQTY